MGTGFFAPAARAPRDTTIWDGRNPSLLESVGNTDEELAAAFRVAARFDPSGEVAEMLGLS